jgi:hypothetical protein
VNLDLRTYYTDGAFRRLGEIDSDDGDRITFLTWGRGVDGVPEGRADAFDRSDGHWYFNPPGKAIKQPDALCTVNAPRENFMADSKYIRPAIMR